MAFIADSIEGRSAQQVLKRRVADIEHGNYVEQESELREHLVEKGWDDPEDANFEKSLEDGSESPYYIAKGKWTQEKRDAASQEGHALSDGSYPIDDVGDLESAITLAESGHGNVAAAKSLIRKRAKELGATDKLPEGWRT